MSYSAFVKELREKYGIIADMMWQEEYSMWQKGFRIGLEPQTLAILGGV